MDSLKELIEKKTNQINIIKEKLTNISDINEKNQLLSEYNDLVDEKLKLVEIMNNRNIGDNIINLDNDKNKKNIKKEEYKKPIKRKIDKSDDEEEDISKKLKENYIGKKKLKDGYKKMSITMN